MEIRPRHWAFALVGAVALHLGALVLFWQPSSAETAVAAGLGGIEVSLGPAGAPSGSMTAATDAEAVEPATPQTADATPVTPEEVPSEAAEPTEAVEPVEPVPALVETAEQIAPVPPADLAEVPPPEPVDEIEVVETPPAEAAEDVEVAEAVPLPEPPLREPPPTKPAPPKPVAAAPAPQPAPPAPRTAEPTEEPAPLQTAEAPGDAGKSGDTQLSAAGTGTTTSGGGVPGAVSDNYDALLRSWIDQNHEISRRLKRREIYGMTIVSFTIDRNGNLLRYAVVTSSGHAPIDEAAIETLNRASPMPAMPPDLPGAEYTRQIPIGITPPS